jgi:hypothetical protein
MSLTRVAPSLIAVANNVTSNVFGSANTIPSFTFDASGVISTASNTAIQINTADIVANAVTDAKIVAVANTKITGNIISSQITSVANTQITGNIISSQITSVANTQVTGVLGVAQGGTGASTLTSNNVVLGNGTSAVAFVAPGSNGNLLTSNGTTWTSAAAPSSAPPTSFNEIGTYCVGYGANGTQYTTGSTISGSSITYAGPEPRGGFSVLLYGLETGNVVGFLNRTSGMISMGCTGTWRCMTVGGTTTTNWFQLHLWVRVS